MKGKSDGLTIANTPIQITWRPGIAFMVPDTLSRHPLITDPFCGILHPTAPPTATLYTILVEKTFLLRLSAA